MKNAKYIVIDEKGKHWDPKEYLDSGVCDPEFKIMIEREALGISAEAKKEKPEYLKIAEKLGFRWEPAADIGFLQYDHKADLIMRLVKQYSRELVHKIDMPIYEVRGSNMFDMQHEVVDKYAQLYGEKLFRQPKQGVDLEGKAMGERDMMVMSYDASYPQFDLASKYDLKESDLPLAHYSLSDCYRYEQSGECMLMYRMRRFFMSDIHPYLRDVDHAFDWYMHLDKVLVDAANKVNRRYWNLVKVSSEKAWEDYKDKISDLAVQKGLPMLAEIRIGGPDMYWIIDVDYSIIDRLEQVREICCIQIDVGNAKRLGIEYVESNGDVKNPAIIHAAVPGGIERFVYMLVDDFYGSFPLWLAPVQLRLIPVSEKYVDAVMELVNSLKEQDINLRIEVDDRDLSVGKRVKLAHEDLVPNSMVVGEKELGDIDEVIRKIKELGDGCEGYPFIPVGWPVRVKQQVV